MRAALRRKFLLVLVFVIIVALYGIYSRKFNSIFHHAPLQKYPELKNSHAEIDRVPIVKNMNYLSKLNELSDNFQFVVTNDDNEYDDDDEKEKKLLLPRVDITTLKYNKDSEKVVIPVIVFAYNRPSVSRCIDLLLKYNNVKNAKFPIIVSQDGNHEKTAEVIQAYGDEVTHLRHPNEHINVPANQRRFMGYYKISTHYKWGISATFKQFPNSKAIIIVEDDLEIAPDFFSYFLSTYPMLLRDESLYCVSAWNDNGKENLVDSAGTTVLYRSDFFPGLGWMLKKSTWDEVESKWPSAFWDDWFRLPEQRRNRACLRPEISRTKTFGRIGVSNGQFFDKYLKYIKLNEQSVDWTDIDLSYLEEKGYKEKLTNKIYDLPLETSSSIQSGLKNNAREVRLEYANNNQFKTYARTFGIMEDLKSGVPRMAYQGIVSFMHNGLRVHLAPRRPWPGYKEE